MFKYFNKKNLGGILVGLGLLVLVFRMADISLNNFWPLIIVGLGVYQLRSGGDKKQAQTLIAVGSVLAAFTLNIFGLLSTIWPIAFILAGLYFLTKNIDSAASNNVSNTLETVGRGASRLFKVVAGTVRSTVTDRQATTNRPATRTEAQVADQIINNQVMDDQIIDIDIETGLPNGNAKVEAQSANTQNASAQSAKDPGISSTVLFSSNKLLPDTLDGGGSSTCLFGDLKIDLRDVKEAPEKVKLDLTCGFGDVRLKVPQEWRVELRSSSFFADVSNEARTLDTPTTTLQVQANCFFGDISITN